jgi:hypothetical protein
MDDHLKAMLFKNPERIPLRAGILPSVWMKYREKMQTIVDKHPQIFNGFQQKEFETIACGTYIEGDHTDAWGCVWSNIHVGQEAIVTGHPLKTRADIRKLKIPGQDAGMPHGFMYLRLFDLRGFEEMMVDFAEEPPELQILIDKVLEYNMRQLDIALSKAPPPDPEKPHIMGFGDDNGMQHCLPIGPEKWRKYLKPCYMKLFQKCKEKGYYVYFHTDGCIWEVIPDMIECGVDIINPQIRANGLDNLKRTCKGKVCVALDLDRQLFPFCKPGELDPHVKEAVQAMGMPEGGLILCAEIDDGVPLENADALLAAMEKYSTFFSK